MLVFELSLYLLTALLLTIVFVVKPFRKAISLGVLTITLIMFVLQITLGIVKWQLYPLYIVFVSLLAITIVLLVKDFSFHKTIRKTVLIALIALFVISGLSVFAFPIYQMPEPSGQYLIGTRSIAIIDTDREGIYSNDEETYRRFKIQLWYPAETVEGYEQVPWLEDGLPVARALAKDTGLPSFTLDHTINIMSHSYKNAPIKQTDDGPFPVIIISHGWRGFRNLHTDFAEELASNGYIVIGIDHTYGSVATVFDEDNIDYLNLDALPNRDETPDFLDYANQLVNTYAGDVIETLDTLESLNANPAIFNGQMDLTKIGLLGHSTGGGADVTVALQDPRIDAVIGLDAWVEPIEEELVENGLDMPSLFLRSGQWEEGFNNTNLYTLIQNSALPSELYQIDGTTHYDFTMVYMYSPLTKLIGFTGDVEGRTLNSMLEFMILDFFEIHLKGIDSSYDYSLEWEEVKTIEVE